MKEQLVRYIDLLFAGAPQASEVKQEILQNTLDRYDDLISQGKSPEAAYRLAISGIGDISEILGDFPNPSHHPLPRPLPSEAEAVKSNRNTLQKRIIRACAVTLYILSPIPLISLQDELGLCILLLFVSCATLLMILSGKRAEGPSSPAAPSAPANAREGQRSELRRSIKAIIWTAGLCAYFLLSFVTSAWYITWLVFPITASVQGLVMASMDLKEAL